MFIQPPGRYLFAWQLFRRAHNQVPKCGGDIAGDVRRERARGWSELGPEWWD